MNVELWLVFPYHHFHPQLQFGNIGQEFLQIPVYASTSRNASFLHFRLSDAARALIRFPFLPTFHTKPKTTDLDFSPFKSGLGIMMYVGTSETMTSTSSSKACN